MKLLTVYEQHQLRIARNTLKMRPEMVVIMGGMTRNEAKKIVDKHENKALSNMLGEMNL